MKSTVPRLFTSRVARLLSHENPLGLPRSGTPPNWPRPPKQRRIAGVCKVVAVSSAKGGVGKSTVAANLSIAFAKFGYRSAILDTDLFGPSIPTIFGLSGEPRLSANNQLVPLINYGVKTMSMGYLVGEDAPVVWRGPMVMKAVQQLLHEVDWGGVDVLVMDLPPGTGDTQLTITQQVVLDGAIIVTTPHTLAVKDAAKGIAMFQKVNVNILGLVENMALYRCPHCSAESYLFGSASRVGKLCTDHSIDLIAGIPLDPAIGEGVDNGKPVIAAGPSDGKSAVFMDIARKIAAKVGLEEHDASR